MIKKKIKKGIGAVIMTSLIGSLNACGINKQEWKNQAEELLKAKYGEEFRVSAIGKSYGSLGNRTYTVLCSPVSDETCLFQAEIDKDGTYFQDGYISELASRELEETIEKELEGLGKNCFIHAAPGSKYVESSDTELTLKEFLEMNPKNRFAVYGAIEGEKEEEKEIEEAVGRALSQTAPVSGSLRLSFVSGETLEAIRKKMEKTGVTDSEFIELMSKGEEFLFSIEGEGLFPSD